MLLLYHDKIDRILELLKIYIPLCFYFIATAVFFEIVNIHLHSTMLLLYPRAPLEYRTSAKEFTFHYASTLSRCCSQFLWGLFIYIPLCFYFIAAAAALAAAIVAYLHSTMLLLYQLSVRQVLHSSWIYIPLCFYFIGWSGSIFSAQRLIYIPLCFYFISRKPVSRRRKINIYIPLCFYFIVDVITAFNWLNLFTFHYASTLSRLEPFQLGILDDLHSTMLLLYPVAEPKPFQYELIYIPLCFYFIVLCAASHTLHIWFTFHYASTLSPSGMIARISSLSIYIPLCFYFISAMPGMLDLAAASFTFHYASTLSSDRHFRIAAFLDLHSTMLLLYRNRRNRGSDRYTNLHSTMLLLYRNSERINWDISTFTFHYASTLSRMEHDRGAARISFTFHYASTLSDAAKCLSPMWIYLHSTMLLLYRSCAVW